MEAHDPQFRKLVESIDVFDGLAPEDVYKIFARGMTLKVLKNQTVFHKGTVGSQMFVILGGKMGVYDGENRIATLTTGDTFGEMSLLNQEPRSATVIALEESRLFALNEDVFQKLLTKHVAVKILFNIARMLAGRLKNANLRVLEAGGR